jgi:HEAT repeat-containing protein 5
VYSNKCFRSDDDDKQHEDVDQLFELTRLIVLVLTNLLPNLGETKKTMRHELNEEAVDLIRASLDALVDAAEVFPAVIKTDLYACIFHIFISKSRASTHSNN